MFWKRQPTIDENDEAWQLEAWAWLLQHLGGLETMRSYRVAAPSHADFPPSKLAGHAHAEFVFGQVARRFRVATDAFELVAQEEDIDPVLAPLAVVKGVPANPAGTYSVSANRHAVTYAPSLLGDLEALIATFAHEICHPILLDIPEEPPGGGDMEEFATDLAMVFFGFGIFGANGAYKFSQYNDAATGTQGWRSTRAGYLTQAEWGFGLAVRQLLLVEDEPTLLTYLSTGAAAHYRKNFRYLKDRADLLQTLQIAGPSAS